MLKIGLQINIFTPKNDLDLHFAYTREVIQKFLNQNSSRLKDFVQAFGPHLFDVDAQHLKRKNRIFIFPGK